MEYPNVRSTYTDFQLKPKHKISLNRALQHIFYFLVYILGLRDGWVRYYSDDMMSAMASQITGPCLFTSPFVQAQSKENIKAPGQLALLGEFTGDWWIPCTKSQYRGKCYLMTLSRIMCHSVILNIDDLRWIGPHLGAISKVFGLWDSIFNTDRANCRIFQRSNWLHNRAHLGLCYWPVKHVLICVRWKEVYFHKNPKQENFSCQNLPPCRWNKAQQSRAQN